MKENYPVSNNSVRKNHNRYYFFVLFIVFLFSGLIGLHAQKMEKIPGVPVVCPAKFEDMNSRMAMRQLASKKFNATSKSVSATAELLVTFGPGAQGNAEVEDAFRFALDIWSKEIVSSVPIRIFADFANLGPGVLASAGPTTLISNFEGAPTQEVFYPVALANSLAGVDLAPDLEFDLVVNIGNSIPWYFGTDGNTPAGQFDFVTVALHEAGHGLGFVDGGNVNNNTGVGSINNGGNPFVFDTFIVDGEGNSVLEIPNPSVALGDFFTSGDVFVNGSFAVAALGGTLPELFAPNPFQGGSSIAHWDEVTFPAGDPNSLMSPQVGSSESNFNIGDITRGHFRDMGWVLAEQAPINAIPASFNEEMFINETLVLELAISNISDSPAVVSASAGVGSNIIASFSPTSLTLESAETANIDITLNTSGITKGVYEESVELNIEGFDGVVTVPVTIRVLDGTETPMVVVTPETFDETIQQFLVVTKDLTIENTGDDDLNYSITINDSPQITFASRAENSKATIAKNGFSTQVLSNSGLQSVSALVGANSTVSKVVTNLYAEDFEDFVLGDVVDQFGWFGRFENNWVISNANAFDGSQHFRGVSDGFGPDRDASPLALSPLVTPGDEPFMVLSANVNIQGSGVSWEIIPQSPTAELVVTRLRFNGDGSVDVLDGVGGFVPLNVTTPEGYFNVRIVIDKDDLGLTVFFDDALVYSGTGATSLIEGVAFLSDMAVTGSTMDIDNFEITDGDPNAFFLSVSPVAGVVPFGDTTVASVKFDARSLEPGEYSATINIVSNDSENASIDIPVSLTVLSPPTIEVNPDALSASVNVQTDDPPIKTDSFTITNNGQSPLDFTTALGPVVFTPPNNGDAASIAKLDLSKYGKGNTKKVTEKLAGKSSSFQKIKEKAILSNLTFTDSIFYDSGIEFPDDFSGVDTAPYTSAVNFDVESDFTLTAVRNGYRTEAVVDPVIILEIYKGGATPNDGELLLSQTVGEASAEGIVAVEQLDIPLSFSTGESFWVVHKYPEGISFPQGVDATATQRPDTYFFSGDGGDTYSPSGFVFFVRALSGDTSEPYISMEPSTGILQPGSSVDVQVTFDASTLANGTFNTDILVNSNDPINPTETVATTFEVSGQVSEIVVSDELLLFNNVFLEAQNQRTFTITNSGLAILNVSSIVSDNDDFSVEPSSATLTAGEELEVTVIFAPSSLGSINGILTITSDASNIETVEVVLNGVGVDPPIAVLDPQEITETTDAGTTVDSQITLQNDGNSPLIYSFPDLAVASALADPNVKLNNTEIISFEAFTSSKGFKDTRIGSPIEYSIGTDNGFGYSWIDSDEDGGPVNNFFDITGIGTDITAVLGADGTASGPLAFPFEYYGATYETLFINANGFVSLQAPTTTSPYINQQIPIDDGVNNVIAGLWTDLEPQNGGSVHVAGFLDAFVIQWTNTPVFAAAETGTVTFQMILFDNGNIDVYYADVDSASFLDNATIGIENADGSDGAQVAFNTDYVKDGLALRFVKPAIALTPFISTVDPLSGVVPAGGSRSLTVTLDATELNDGKYFDELVVSSNAPDKGNSTALFEFNVIGTPEIQVVPDALNFEPIFIGLSSEASFSIENIGSKTLEVSEITNGNTDFVLDIEAPLTLDPGESTSVFVTFSPSSIGTIEDEITFTSNDGFGNETIQVSLTGVGVDPPIIALSPEAIDLTLAKGQSATEIVTIVNNGGSTLNYAVSPPSLSAAGDVALIAQQYVNPEFERLRSKKEPDNRVGAPFLNASGGPGSFGYVWVDNNSEGPAYDFIDISTDGQLANVGADGDETVALPFEFNFFGETQNTVTIAANGFLTFAPLVGNNFVNLPIPDVGNPNFFIAPLWSDIEPQNGTGVFYKGTADYFIVQYENVPGFGFPPFLPIPDPVTFQVILFPDGSFKMQYKNVDSTLRTTSTVGIEGPDGLSGLQVIFNNEYLTDGLAITFTPPVSGTLEPGESVDVPIEISAEQLEVGNYEGSVIVSSNDPVSPATIIPVTLEVVPAPEIVSFTLINADTDEPIGTLEEGDIIDLNDYPTNSFNAVANIGELAVGSVVFDFNDEEGFRTENSAPYVLGGDSGGSFNSLEFPLGSNTITGTPYSGGSGSGDSGIALTINFEVIDSGLPEEPLSLVLINAITDEPIGTLADGDIIDLSEFASNSFNIAAEVEIPNIGSVVFDYNGVFGFQTENLAPYALGGDSGGNYSPLAFPTGTNTVTATVYTSRNGGGNAIATLTINFDVTEGTGNTASKVYPNPVERIANVYLESDQATILKGTLFDLSGSIVSPTFDFEVNNQGTGFVDMTSLAQGIYILRLTDARGKVVSQMKVVKR